MGRKRQAEGPRPFVPASASPSPRTASAFGARVHGGFSRLRTKRPIFSCQRLRRATVTKIPWAPISAIAASQSRDVARRAENKHVGEVSQASLSARGSLGKEARLRNRPGARHKGVSLGC